MTALYIIIAVVAVALIALTILFFIKKKKAKAAAQASSEEGAPGSDDFSLLIREAEAKLGAAKLENSKVGSLPVFIVMGEPGTTKTSVMLHCGLEAEHIAGQVYQGGNVTPTRAGNFWFSRKSVFAETGSSLLADANKWKAAVKRLQPRSSVRKGEQAGRAAVVCFDCENFTKPGAADLLANSARTMRSRLGDISQAMGINLPVYVLFTKLDRLPFFTEFVRNLNAEEATQVVGVTLPMVQGRREGVYGEQEAARLTAGFEGLFRGVADARPEFLARENDGSKLPPEYEFPREFRKIRPSVVQFLVDLCRPAQLTVGPFLRGFYFTGVRPVVVNETAPVTPAAPAAGFGGAAGATQIFNPRAMAAGSAPAPVVTGTRKVPQWLFLSHLFNDVLLADKAALGASGSSTKTSGMRRALLIAAASLCFLLTLFFTISFFNNHSLESQVSDAAKGLASAPTPSGVDLASVDSLRRLETLRQAMEKLVGFHRDGRPFFYGWFLYIGDDLYKVARRIYFNRFQQMLLAQTQGNIVADMKTIPSAPVKDHEYQPTYDELKAYLITTNHHEKSTKLFLTPALMRWWSKGHDVDADRTDLARKQFDFYADELKEENPFSSENDTQSIEKTRAYLKQFAGNERIYAYMLAEADKAGTPVNFNKQFPGSSAFVVDAYDVRGAFSSGGWKFMNDAFGKVDQFFSGEPWVLGEESGPAVDRAKLAADLKARYHDDFIKEWTTYFKTASVVKYMTLADAAQKLKAHSSNQAPLLELSSLASKNTNVADPAYKDPFQPAQAVTPPDNPNYVAPSNTSYINALVALQGSIETVAAQGLTDANAAPALQLALAARGTVSQMANGFRVDSPIQQQLQKLLTDPIIDVEGLLKGANVTELNAGGAGACKLINPILAKYPFKANGPEATVADINTVFNPKDGAVWAFVNSKLVPKYLTKQGAQYAPVGGGTVTIQQPFLHWINKAAAFTDIAYAGGSTDPHFNYTITPEVTADMDKVTLAIDGQSGVFTSTTQKNYTWPGTPPGTVLTITYKGGFQAQVTSLPGLWSVFHFVSEANHRNGLTIDWVATAGNPPRPQMNPTTSQPITIRFNIGATPPIFTPGYFTFNCVSEVAK